MPIFAQIFGARDVVNFPHAREAGVTNQENVEQATENEGKWYLITVKFPRQVPPQIQITLEIIHPPPPHTHPEISPSKSAYEPRYWAYPRNLTGSFYVRIYDRFCGQYGRFLL